MDAKAVANYFLELAKENGEAITPMKLLKLVYFAHGWCLALTEGEPLIDEAVQAWQYGPVIPSLYQALKGYGGDGIDKPIEKWVASNGAPPKRVLCKIEDGLKPFLRRIWDVYGGYTGIQLSNMTHQKGTPWAQVWKPRLPLGTSIPNDIIQKYFAKQKLAGPANG